MQNNPVTVDDDLNFNEKDKYNGQANLMLKTDLPLPISSNNQNEFWYLFYHKPVEPALPTSTSKTERPPMPASYHLNKKRI